MQFRFLFFTILLLGSTFVQAQFVQPPNPSAMEVDSNKIEILHIGTFKERTTPEGVFRELISNVHLKQKEMHIWCDLGFISPNKQIQAYNNVQMLQNDSIRIFSDSLFYDGIGRLAKLRQDVVLKDTSMTMFTQKLDYDVNTKIATFPEGSIIESDSSTMVSKRGTYNANTNIAHFQDSVRITHPDYKLTADSLAFNTQTETAFILGPTKIYNEHKMVYCEDGYYDSKRSYAELYKNARFESDEDGKKELAEGDKIIYDGKKEIYYLTGNAHYQNEEQEVYADTILMDAKTEQYFFRGNPKFKSKDTTENQSIDAKFSTYDAATKTMLFRGDVVVSQESQIITTDSLDYNSETKSGIARGNVVWQDTTADMKISCGTAYYNDSTKFLLAKDKPLLTTLVDGDTLWLRADTLLSMPDTMDTKKRNMQAFHHVQLFKSNIQAVCDSLFYDNVDSSFHFYTDPILWVDGTQFTADSIHIYLKYSKIHQVLLNENSFIVNTNDTVYFNQVKGRNITTQFSEGKIKTMYVTENGETIYYAADDQDRYMGVNDVDCSNMLIYFGEKQVQRIRFEGKPKAILYPMHQVDHNILRLVGFQWLEKFRIKDKNVIIDGNNFF